MTILLDEHGQYVIENLSMVRGGKGKPFKVHLNPKRHIILDQNIPPRGWYKDKTPENIKRVRPRPCYTEATLTTPYGGYCPVGCNYCYVNNGTRGYRSTGLPTVDPNYPEKMAKRIKQLMVTGAFYITSFTEPFHPSLENKYHITQRLSDILVGEGLPFFYLSKRLPPDWAYDMLSHNPYSYMQWSINTANNDHWRRMAPGAPDLEDMYDAIYAMHDEGIYVSVQCNPIVAGITTLEDIVTLCEQVAEAGAQHIIFKFVEQVFNNRQVIIDRMNARKLPHVDTFNSLFSQTIGGVYTIQEDVRIEWLDVLLEETRKLGLTMSLCYEYYDNGAAGGNLAPFYTTGDQCHGRGVPMYFRPEKGAPWEPLAGCYRKGCLYCQEYGTHACRNEKLLEASALQYKDLRSIKLIQSVSADATLPNGTKIHSDGWNWEDSCYHPNDAHLYVDMAPIGNPDLMTDAEMWGWELSEDG